VDTDDLADGRKQTAASSVAAGASWHRIGVLQCQSFRTNEWMCHASGVESTGPTGSIDHMESFAYLSFVLSRLFGIAADARR
jgi:hypothetical protein